MTKTAYTVRLPDDLSEQIETYADEHNLSESDAIRALLRQGQQYEQHLDEIHQQLDEIQESTETIEKQTRSLWPFF